MPYVNDNSGETRSIVSSVQSGDRLKIGSTNVTYTVEDGSGNMNRCMFEVVVTGRCASPRELPLIGSKEFIICLQRGGIQNMLPLLFPNILSPRL